MIAHLNSLKFLPAIAFCTWISISAAPAAEPGREQVPGKVVVADVVNKVEAVAPGQGSRRSLSKKQVISERHTVIAGDASSATLVFSNGSTIGVQEKTTLVISEFLQNPFSTPFAMAIESEEPSTSTTKLNLQNGEVVCKVKKLRKDEGSSLTVETPVGAAGVRGTTFAVSFLPNQNGTDQGTFVLSVTEGEVSMTDGAGNVTTVRAGQQLVIQFKSEVDPITGETKITEIISKRIQDIPADQLARINREAAEGDADAESIVFEPTDANILQLMQFSDELLQTTDTKPLTEVDPPANGDEINTEQ